jgi:hypothetical protein
MTVDQSAIGSSPCSFANQAIFTIPVDEGITMAVITWTTSEMGDHLATTTTVESVLC